MSKMKCQSLERGRHVEYYFLQTNEHIQEYVLLILVCLFASWDSKFFFPSYSNDHLPARQVSDFADNG